MTNSQLLLASICAAAQVSTVSAQGTPTHSLPIQSSVQRAASGFSNNLPIRRRIVSQTKLESFPRLSQTLTTSDLNNRIGSVPQLKGRLRGLVAERDFLKRNPSYRPISSRTASQFDVYRWDNGKFVGGQIKVLSGNTPAARHGKYLRAMKQDYMAPEFFVPKDHYTDLRRTFAIQTEKHLSRGNMARAAELERHAGRLRPLNRSFGQIDRAVSRSLSRTLPVQAAGRIAGPLVPLVIDTAPIVADRAKNRIDNDEAIERLGEAGVRAAGVGAGYAICLAAGATPVGMVTVGVGFAAYWVTDQAIDTVRPMYHSSPMMSPEIENMMPNSWSLIRLPCDPK